ncbi:hypothetical protein KA005_19075 [bacterium]|nr:hypothetical protein [bacterium]
MPKYVVRSKVYRAVVRDGEVVVGCVVVIEVNYERKIPTYLVKGDESPYAVGIKYLERKGFSTEQEALSFFIESLEAEIGEIEKMLNQKRSVVARAVRWAEGKK